jgi:ABC-type amino acid transport substrate-binding protein
MNANIKKLLSGRGRFIYQSEVEILSALKDEKSSDFVKIQPIPTVKSGRYIAFSKNVSSDIIRKVEIALKKLEENGTLEKTYKRYI